MTPSPSHPCPDWKGGRELATVVSLPTGLYLYTWDRPQGILIPYNYPSTRRDRAWVRDIILARRRSAKLSHAVRRGKPA